MRSFLAAVRRLWGWGVVSPTQKAEMVRELQGTQYWGGGEVREGALRCHPLLLLGWCPCVSSGTPPMIPPLGGPLPQSSGLYVAHTTSALPSTQARLLAGSQV